MRVCVLTTQLDSFKGGNHLPLFGALKDVDFTIITGKAKLEGTVPANVTIINLDVPLGSYYFGNADRHFAQVVLHAHPPHDPFWTQFDVIHLNQTLSPDLLKIRESGILYAVHHPVTADRDVAVAESIFPHALGWRARYALLIARQRRICKEAPHILTVSRTVKERIMADYGCKESRVTIVPNGVDGNEFRPSDEPSVADVIAVGSFIHPRKGFRYLLQAYQELSRQGKKIADVGRRSGEQSALLRNIPGVTVYGTVPHERLVALMRGSSALLSTSLYEGFGLSLIEALACGKPAFAFGSGAVPEVLSPIDPSLIVEPRNVSAMTERVLAFLALPEEERVSKGIIYREKVLALYSLERTARELEACYHQIA